MNGDGDLDIDLGFHLRAVNAVEQKNLWDASTPAQRRRLDPPPEVLGILEDYAHEKILRVAQQEGGLREAVKALSELLYVMRMLTRIGHPEFKGHIEKIETGMARTRQRLVREFLSPATPPDEVQLIEEALIHIIRRGAWPNWEREFNAAVEARRCIR
jgi:hypothetical protein